MGKFYNSIGIPDTQIRRIMDPDFAQLENFLGQVWGEVGVQSTTNKQKVLVYAYYVGHGAVDLKVCAILNERQREYYPIERFFEVMGTYNNIFVVTVLDCCRSKIPKEKGGAPDLNLQPVGFTNFLCTYSTEPDKEIIEANEIVDPYVAVLQKKKDANGVVVLPMAIMSTGN
eukprot:CAMPEP_0176374250 /NCGR_PEP_ID=MMETSP0126-20121128/26629_1 /TAXON_ID=141414 ORGANISM="Strombidinopsis acuminatum, Strain SPMC142" /NCGR_SAMPLE_ID=MMETSP0126 /ASSEMBLY_ACC=CAM_ASM_000229 /LENGTH=171 /DNA_ID=CAMNT_0017734757 /DNA_START=183 /DNA_END=698 /DNA_ORIENTATION=+